MGVFAMLRHTWLALALLCACDGEFRIGEPQGLKPMSGDARTSTEGLTCGQPLRSDGYTATSEVVGNDCRFTFERDVTLLSQEEYAQVSGLAGAVKAVELEVKAIAFIDEDTGVALSVQTQLKEASFAVNG